MGKFTLLPLAIPPKDSAGFRLHEIYRSENNHRKQADNLDFPSKKSIQCSSIFSRLLVPQQQKN
jgi:hypothetical protein